MRRKLLPHAVAELAAAAEAAAAECGDPPPVPDLPAAAKVEAVLDWLEAQGHLSQQRFAESRVHARSARFGNLRIRSELKQHQIVLAPEAAQALSDSELQRARAVRERKFADLPANAAERARQSRFLAGRGFSPAVISRALRAAPDADDASD